MEFIIRTKDKGGNYKEIKCKKVVPDGRMNPGSSHAFRTVKAEYQARYLSGRNGVARRGSDRQFARGINSFSKYCETKGIYSMDNLNTKIVMNYVHELKENGSFTRASKTVLKDGSIGDLVGALRTMLLTTKQDYMLRGTYSDMGLDTSKESKENPIKFRPDYEVGRDTYQACLEKHRTKWYAEAAAIGRAFGLREAERIESRDLITRIKGELCATHKLGKMKPITEKQLKERYGKTIMERTKTIKEGKTFLIVEHAKGYRNRFVEVRPGKEQAAVDRLHNFIRSNPAAHCNHMRVYPDVVSNEKAERNYSSVQGRYGADKESQNNCTSDRHHKIQEIFKECRTAGMTYWQAAKVCIEYAGHEYKEKIWRYIEREN